MANLVYIYIYHVCPCVVFFGGNLEASQHDEPLFGWSFAGNHKETTHCGSPIGRHPYLSETFEFSREVPGLELMPTGNQCQLEGYEFFLLLDGV